MDVLFMGPAMVGLTFRHPPRAPNTITLRILHAL